MCFFGRSKLIYDCMRCGGAAAAQSNSLSLSDFPETCGGGGAAQSNSCWSLSSDTRCYEIM